MTGGEYRNGAKANGVNGRLGSAILTGRPGSPSPDSARLDTRRWGTPTLHVQEAGIQRYSFQLRSRVNVPLLAGGPLSLQAGLEEVARNLMDRCSQESSLRVDSVPAGFCLSLLDADAEVIGRSEVLATEAFARAMKRLIAVQAQRAEIILQTYLPG